MGSYLFKVYIEDNWLCDFDFLVASDKDIDFAQIKADLKILQETSIATKLRTVTFGANFLCVNLNSKSTTYDWIVEKLEDEEVFHVHEDITKSVLKDIDNDIFDLQSTEVEHIEAWIGDGEICLKAYIKSTSLRIYTEYFAPEDIPHIIRVPLMP